jgi:hypothetical protein
MKKIIKIISLILITANSFAQVSVNVGSLTYSVSSGPAVIAANCGTIDFGLNSSTSINITVNLTKPSNQVVGAGKLYVYTKGYSSNLRVERASVTINDNWISSTSYVTGTVFTLNASDFGFSQDILYVAYVSSGNVEYKSCNYMISKTPSPTFTLSPQTLFTSCNNNSNYSFSVLNEFNSPGTLYYNWNVGNGWTRNGVPVYGIFTTTENNITLSASPSASLPSNVQVTPIYNGVAQPTKTSIIKFNQLTATFSTIAGPNSICTPTSSSVYTIDKLASIFSVSSWRSTNPAIATVTSNGNNAVVNSVGLGSFDLVATLTNLCGQSINISKTIWVGVPSVIFQYNYFEPQPVKSTLCVYSNISNYTLEQQGVTNIIFKNYNTNTILQNSNSNCRRTTKPNCIEATITNACGSSTIVYDCFDRKQAIINNNYTVYPNPSKNVVNIDIIDQNSFTQKKSIISAELYDLMGLSKLKVGIKNYKTTFSVAGLPTGIYILKINIDGTTENHQVVVE